jgi:hypothetical protein
LQTVGRVVVASGVGEQRGNTACAVVVTGCVALEGAKAVGRVVDAGGVLKRRLKTNRGIVLTG